MSATVENFSTICARCDGPMVVTKDAVGRDRLRCPKCDGVSQRGPRHPDDAMIPQGLVHAGALPPVQLGQLRCQRCARGVEGQARLCTKCQRRARAVGATTQRRSMVEAMRRAVYRPRVCRGPCGLVFTPTFERRFYCEACQAKLPANAKGCRVRRAMPAVLDGYRPCGNCGRPTLRRPGRPRKDCEACR